MEWAKAHMSEVGKKAISEADETGGGGGSGEEDGRRRLCQFCGMGDGATHGRVGKECTLRLQALWHAGAPTVVEVMAQPQQQQLDTAKGLGKGKGPELFMHKKFNLNPDILVLPDVQSSVSALQAPSQYEEAAKKMGELCGKKRKESDS